MKVYSITVGILVLFALLVVGLTSDVLAQHQRGQHRFLTQLSEDQRAEIKEIVESMRGEEATREEIRAAVDEKLEEWGIELPEGPSPGFGRGGVGPLHDKLTEEQRAEIKEMVESMGEGEATREEIRAAVDEKLEEWGIEVPEGARPGLGRGGVGPLHDELTEEQLQELRVKFGLDKTIPMQYVDWVGGIFTGDFGLSIYYDADVGYLIGERMPITIYLGILSFIISAIFGIGFGVICALRRGTWIDTFVTFLANIGITAPAFWVGIILIYLLALKAGWLPVSGWTLSMASMIATRAPPSWGSGAAPRYGSGPIRGRVVGTLSETRKARVAAGPTFPAASTARTATSTSAPAANGRSRSRIVTSWPGGPASGIR